MPATPSHPTAPSHGRRRAPALALLLWFGLGTAALAQVDEAVDRARTWLVGQQRADGGFGPETPLDPRDSGAAVEALLRVGGGDGAVPRGLVYLAGVPEAAAELRVRRTLALARGGRPVSSLLDSLGEFQNGGGQAALSRFGSNSLDSSLATRALALEEPDRLLEIVPLLDFLQLGQNGDGGWGYLPGDASRLYYSAEASLALAAVDRLAVAAEVLSTAESYLRGAQLPDGGFGTSLETALAYRALLALGTDVASLPASPVDALLAAQRADGSWGGDVFTTAQVLHALADRRPNLLLTELRVAPETVLPGETVEVRATVVNRGARPAPANRLAIRREATGDELGSGDVPALDPGASHTAELTVPSEGIDGELVLVAVADADEAVDEADETDNDATARVVIRDEADLALFGSDLEVSPARPAPGEGFELRVSARNQGGTEVASFSYRVDRLVAGEPVEVLAQGTADPAPPGTGALVVVPLSLPEGEHVLRVELDPEDAVAEADESNNAAELAFFVVDPSLPDLAVAPQDLTVTPERPAEGDPVTVQAVVRNLGGSEATADVAFYDGDPAGGGLPVHLQEVAVAAGSSAEVSASFTVGAETRQVVVLADPDDALEELSETNNSAASPLADLPDLAIGRDNLELAPAEPLEGETAEGAVTVRNAGTAAASDVAVEVYDGEPDAGAPPVFAGTVPALPPGGNHTLRFSWTASGGRHRLVAVADLEGAVRELSDTNNRARREVAVPRAAGPDLEVSGLDLSGLEHPAETLTVSGVVAATLTNSGDAAVTTPFLVRLFEDRDGDGRFTPADRELAATTVDSTLDPGASASLDLPVDADLLFYRPLLRVAVDATDVIPERDETDNLREVFGVCRVPPPPASFDAEEEWFLPGLEVESAPVVVQLSDDDGDGRIDGRDVPDVVFHTEDAEGRAVTARSGLDGSELWTFRSTPDHPLAGRIANVAAADLDGDGIAEVLGIQSNRRLVALDHRGRVLWTSDPVETAGGRDWAGAPAVGDLDGDGVPEIAVGRSVLSNTGRLLAQGTANVGRNHNFYGPFGVPYLIDAPLSTIVDVDLDGRAELVAGDSLYRLEGDTLQVVWDRTVPDRLMVDGFTAVGNLDGDPEAEIVYVSSNQVMVLDHDGTVARPRRVIQPIVPFGDRTFWAGPPSLGDLTGDGETEILIAVQQELFALRSDLSTLWRVPTTERSEMTAAVPFDLDGDGADEVIVLDQTELRILDGATGSVLHARPNTSKTATETPVVADVDSDGRAEILVPSNRSFGGDASTQGLHALGHPSWRGTRSVWTQHTHRGTNALADGTIPSAEVPHWQLGTGFRSNLELPAPERLLPNLTVGLPRVGRATGEGVPVVVRVGNGGLATVPPGARVALFDADPATGAAPVAEGSTATALRPGAFEDVAVLWQVAGAAGQTAWVAVDPAGVEAECAEDDNALAFVVEESVLPDLTVPAGGVEAAEPRVAGQVVPVTVEVENAGAAQAPEAVVRVFDGEPTGGRLVGETTVGPLGPGESVTAEVPWDTLGSFPGPHTLHAVADPDDLLFETVEDNNRGLLDVELSEPGLPDLSVEDFTVEPASLASGESTRFAARVANRGAPLEAGSVVAFRVNRSEVGRVEIPEALGTGEERTAELLWSTAGRQGVLAVEAAADPDGAVAEVTEANNLAEAELSVAGPDLTVATATDRTSYAPGDTVAVTVTAENLGSSPRDVQLRVAIDDGAGVRIADLEAAEVTLPVGTSTFELSWDTEGALPGAYAAVAELLVDGVPVARGEALFSLERQVEVAASLFADRDLYPPGASAVLTGRVANRSASTVLSDLTAALRIVGPGGAEVFTASRSIAALFPGSNQRLEEVWEVGDAAPGAYTAELAVRDASGLLLAFDSAALAVEDSSETGAGLRGELTVGPDPVGAGAPLLAELAVANEGNVDLADLELRVDLLDLAGEETVASLAVPRPLAREEAAREALAFATGELPAGDYLATLVGVLPGVEVRLDRAAVTVAAGISVGDASVPEGDGGSAVLRFPVTLSEALPDPVTVDFVTADGTARSGADYQAASGALTLPAGATEGLVEVTVLGDTEPEADEVLLLTLSDPSGALLGDAQALGTIQDEEGCPSPDLLANGGAEEGTTEQPVAGWEEVGTGGWRLRFGDPAPIEGRAAFAAPAEAGAVELVQTVDLAPFAGEIDGDGQAFLFEGFVRSAEEAEPDVAGVVVEYLDAAGAELDRFESAEIVSPGAWRAVSDLRTAPAGTRAVRVRLLASRAAGGASLEVYFDRLALRSVGTPALHVGDAEAPEGDDDTTALAFPVTLSCAVEVPVTVDFVTTDGTATAGTDYQAASGSLTLPAGETGATIEVTVLGDTLDEPDESFELGVSTPDGPILLRPGAVGSIRDDDGPSVLSVADVNVPEGDDGTGEATVQVSLSAVSGRTVSASWATADGTATAGSDYRAASGSVTVPAGATAATIAVPVLGDRLNEPAETFSVTLSAPQNAALGDGEAAVTILDDDPVEIRVADARVVEGDAGEVPAAFAVTLSSPSVAEVSVDFATADAPSGAAAEAGLDYRATAGTLVFAPGETAAEVAVPVLGDTEQEPVETFLLTLSGPSGGHPGASLADPEAVGSIVDDDGILLSVDDVILREVPGAEAVFQVSLNKATTVDVSADYRTVDGTATAGADYEEASGTATIPAGAAATEVSVPVLDDALYEPPQSFTLELTNPSGDAVLLDPSGEGTILDDDGWALNGSADDTAIPGCIVLTPDAAHRRSSVWRKAPLDLSRSFDKTFRVYLGDRDSGGHGIYFALQSSGLGALGGGGGRLGYLGIRPSVGVEVDTVTDFRFLRGADHLSIALDGSEHSGHAPVPLPLFDVEDGEEHELRVIWNAVTQDLDVHFDGVESLVYPDDLVASVFDGDPQVFWGLTGATSSLRNLQYFCETARCFEDGAAPAVSVGDAFVVEGDSGAAPLHFPVTLSCPSDEPVTVEVTTEDGTAVAGEDYLPVSETLTFAPGETAKDLVVDVAGDTTGEKDEELFAVLSAPAGGELRHERGTGRIETDDTALSVPEELVAVEGTGLDGFVTVPVTLSAALDEQVAVSWTATDGTAVAGEDYVGAAGEVTYPAGATEGEIPVRLLGDGLVEGDEVFFLELTAEAPVTPSDLAVEIRILDDDDCPSPNLLVNPSNDEPVVDGEIPGWTEVVGSEWGRRASSPPPFEGGAYFVAGRRRDVLVTELRQDVDVSGWAARIDSGEQRFAFQGFVRSFPESTPDSTRIVVDYLDATGSEALATFDTGEITSTAVWKIVGALTTAPPGTRWIAVRLIGTYYNGSVINANFDALSLRALGAPTVSAGDVEATEGSSGSLPVAVPFRLSCPAEAPASVQFVTADGTATAGSDYRAASGTVEFAPGDVEAFAEVPILGDTENEGDETFTVRLANPSGVALARSEATVTILDDESELSIGDTTAVEGDAEGGLAVFTVTLGPALDQTVRVDYATADGTAEAGEDYVAASGTLTLEPGEAEGTIEVELVGDGDPEPDETFSLRLSNPVNATLGEAEGTGTIVDDDARISIADTRVAEGDSGTVQAVFPVTLSGESSQVVTVSFATEDGTATAGEDYQAASGTLTFQPGQVRKEIAVPVQGDPVFEPSETFHIRLSDPVNGVVQDAEALGTIVDDDDCPGPNLLRNPGAEEFRFTGGFRSWTEAAGSWTARTAAPAPHQGEAYFSPTGSATAELSQEVDVSGFAAFIDAGIQRFAFEGFLRSGAEDPADTGRMVVEYLDGDATVVERFDSGEIASPGEWRQVADLRLAPVGTRTVRVRLIARRAGSSGNADAYFDGLALRSLGTPVLQVDEAAGAEGDTGTALLEIPVRLTCSAEAEVTARFETAGGSALAGTDYLPTSGQLAFAPGETVRTVPVTVLGDTAVELEETILLALSEVSGAALVEDTGRASILDDDGTGSLTREMRTFWIGDLRIFAWSDDTEITLIDVDTGEPLSMSDRRIRSANVDTNPFTLAESGDAFEGEANRVRVRVIASDATGQDQLRPVTVWTGSLGSGSQHPEDPPSVGDAWASYLPAFSLRARANGRELGRQFLGFTSRELTLFVRPGPEPTVVQIEDLVTNTDPDDDDGVTLGPEDAEYRDDDIEIYYLDGFEDDTVRIAANADLSVLAGMGTRAHPDWTISPPSYSSGDDGIELGNEFYTFVHRSLTVFPVEDDTTVTITDLSDGDDSRTITLEEGDTDGPYELFTPVLSTRTGSGIVARPSDPAVTIHSTGDPFDDDYVKVTSDKPVLVYVGPPGSDVNEFADVAFSVPTGPESRIIYCYAQNGGGQDDLQIFGFTDDTAVTITSLSRTRNFNASGFHDFRIGPGIAGSSGWLRGQPGSDVWWGSDVWTGELLRIESNKPVVVINGDYDDPHFGAFIPFLVDSLDLPPVADAGQDRTVTAGEPLVFDGTGSFDQDDLVGPLTPRWIWDVDLDTDSDGDGDPENDAEATGATPEHTYFVPGTYRVGLTFFDDEGEADDDEVRVTVEPHPLVLTKAADLDVASPGDVVTYELVVENASAAPVTGGLLEDPLPEHTTLAGPVSVSAGTVTSEDPVRVEIGELAPGAEVSVTIPVRIDAPLDASVDEVVNQGTATGEGLPPFPSDDPATPAPVDPTVVAVEHPPDSGTPDLGATKTDSLALDADGDGAPSPGDEIAYEVAISNAGGASATEVVFRDLAPDHAAVVPGSVETTQGLVVTGDPVEVDLGTLEAGATATVRFRVAVDLPVPAGVDRITNQGTVTSAELPAVLTDDPDAGGDADPTVTMISAAPELVAEKTDRLAADRDGDGAVSPGDDVEYTVTVRNAGNTAATEVFLADPVPEHTAVLPGSVEASAGTVGDEDPVRVDLDELAGGATVEVRFRVRIDDPIAAGVREIENQGLVTSAELPDVVTDDPEVDGAADATVTPVTAAPELRVEKADVLFDDPAGDGLASPGDVLLYRITVANAGNTAATAVVLTDAPPEHSTLEPGTVQAAAGAVVDEDPVTVELGQVDAGTEAVVTFRARIVEPFPLDVLEVSNQAEVASAELEPVASDDPETAEEGDPTATEVFIMPEVTVDDVAVEEAAGADTGAVFTVTLSEASNRPVRVPFATADGSGAIPPPAGTSPATAGLDYQPASGAVNLDPGETEAQVPVEILDDLLDELDETFTLELGEPEGGILARSAGLGTILDDDPPPFVSVGDATVTEGDPGDGVVELLFPVTLSGPSGLGISVDHATAPPLTGRAAEPGEDFEPVSGSLSFPPGTTVATVTVPVIPDRIDELDEGLRLVLSNPVAVLLEDADGLGTVLDDDEARISIDDVTVEEGDSGTADALVPVRLEVPADREITVRYATAAGTATEDEDFLPASSVLAFPAETTERTVAVPVVGDEVLEPLEESLTVELSDPTETSIEDPAGRLTIVDDEECPGPELLANPGAEARPDFGAEPGDLPGWTEVEGEAWQRRFTDPAPAEGEAYFYAGEVEAGELSQEVSVRAYEVRIDELGDGADSLDPRLDDGQRFRLSARVRTFQESPPDTARVVVEYRDRTNSVVLDAFDSGEIASPHEWREVRNVRVAPAGTGWIRVRLIATRFAGQPNDGYFDAVSLRSLRTPTLTVSDVTVFEGDSGETPADFTVGLPCPFHREVTVSYATADGLDEGGATAGSDYRAVSGTLSFAPGETEATVSVPVLGDTVHESHETFFLDLSDVAPAGDVVLLDPRGTGLIVNDDFCPRSPGFWKTHRELWPTDWLDLGGVAYGAEELQGFLEAKGGDMTLHLARQLVATKLNLLVGSDPEILPVVEAADEYLAAFPPGSNPRGQDRKAGEELKDALDAYNNSPCKETPVIPE